MKIAVIGAGAIGALVAGYLKLKGQDVCLIGHAASVREIKEKGLRISGVRGNFNVKIEIAEGLDFYPDLVILATKTQDMESAFKANLPFFKKAVILICQNGVQAEKIACRYLKEENVVSSIVMFGATSLRAGELVHNFEGNWIIGTSTSLSSDGERSRTIGTSTSLSSDGERSRTIGTSTSLSSDGERSRTIGKLKGQNDDKVACAKDVVGKIFPVVVTENILGMKYLKVFVNANNCIPAILGLSMQETFSEPALSRISIRIWKEGLGIMKKAGVSLVSLPDCPLERLIKLTSLPEEEAASVYSGIIKSLSKEPLYGSILQSIKRGRPSEIDYINGEFVTLAKENGSRANLNERLVAMVHEVEQNKRFFSKEELLKETKEVMPA